VPARKLKQNVTRFDDNSMIEADFLQDQRLANLLCEFLEATDCEVSIVKVERRGRRASNTLTSGTERYNRQPGDRRFSASDHQPLGTGSAFARAQKPRRMLGF